MIPRRPMRKAFTLLELLVVIGIITLLAAILVPVMSQVRMRAFSVQTQGEMQRLMTACQAYFHDFNAYPGPLAENMIFNGTPALQAPFLAQDPAASRKASVFDPKGITSSENLALGLIGLLTPPDSAFGAPVLYDPPPPRHDVISLNYTRPASYHYLDFLPDELPTPTGSGGADYYAYGSNNPALSPPTYNDPSQNPSQKAAGCFDSVVPEFMDHIPNPMPILYLRANRGAPVTPTSGIVYKGPAAPGNPAAQYDYTQLAPYGFMAVNYTTTASGKTYDFAVQGVTEPSGLDGWWTYFMNPGIINEPRGKDAFILIDAGPDRLFGTKDDIIVTP